MKIIVVGAGAIGSVIGTLLSRRENVERLVIADRSLEAANALAAMGRGVAEAMRLDAGNVRAMAAAFEGFDLVVNVVLPRFNLNIMQACRDARVNYLDAATDLALGTERPGEPVKAPPEAHQLAMDEEFRKAGLIALLGMGADRLDTVDEILVRDGDNGTVEGHEFASLWSVDTLIEEVMMPALVFRGGRFLRLDSLDGKETFDFPPPVGPLPVYNVDHEETNTLPLFIGKGLRNVDFKISLPDDLAEALRIFRRFGLHGGRLIDVEVKATGKQVRVAPRDILAALMPDPKTLAGKAKGAASIAVVVRGTRGGQRDGWMIWTCLDHQETYRKYGFNATAYPVGAAMAMAASMMANGEIVRTGVFPPEGLEPEIFRKHLPEFGIPVYETRVA